MSEMVVNYVISLPRFEEKKKKKEKRVREPARLKTRKDGLGKN